MVYFCCTGMFYCHYVFFVLCLLFFAYISFIKLVFTLPFNAFLFEFIARWALGFCETACLSRTRSRAVPPDCGQGRVGRLSVSHSRLGSGTLRLCTVQESGPPAHTRSFFHRSSQGSRFLCICLALQFAAIRAPRPQPRLPLPADTARRRGPPRLLPPHPLHSPYDSSSL